MKFISTRGGVSPLSFEEALFTGFAEDGGLLVPETIPQITVEQLDSWRTLSFPELVVPLVQFYIGEEISTEDLTHIVRESFKSFSDPTIIPVVKVGGIFVAELFHGPTLAFKDLALQFVGKILNHFLQLRKKKLSLVIGTSGDTGSAAIQSVKDLNCIECFVLYPIGKISTLQERQMTTVKANNIHVIAMKNTNSDGLDEVVKAMFTEKKFKDEYGISSINSINVVRIILQIVHFFYAYLKVTSSSSEKVVFSVPTGALGNGVAGSLAWKMGLPIQKIILGTNQNNTLTNFYKSGIFEKWNVDIATISPAIDIQVPYNFERILYFMSDANNKTELVRDWMATFAKEGKLEVPKNLMEEIRKLFAIFCVEQDETLELMRNYHESFKYLLDPHSAIGVRAAELYAKDLPTQPHIVCLATAHPGKFPEAVQKATKLHFGTDLPFPPPLQNLEAEETKIEFETDETAAPKLREMIISHY